MSHALQALILIRLEEHDGEWVALAWLTQQLAVPRAQVLALCEQMFANGELQRTDCLGEPCFGVNVVSSSPVVHAC